LVDLGSLSDHDRCCSLATESLACSTVDLSQL
jgi:hypothetical protein